MATLNEKYYNTKHLREIPDLETGRTRPRNESDDEPSIPETYSASVTKSGLRKSIEGRLQWLRFEGDLYFLNAAPCEQR